MQYPQHAAPSIEHPESVRYHEPVPFEVAGLPPESTPAVRARMPLEDGVWESWATFEVTDDGRIDPAEQPPLDGTYEGIDPDGLLWSMERTSEGRRATDEDDVTATLLELSVEYEEKTVASSQVERRFVDEAVSYERIDHPELVGALYRPAGDPPHPTVVVVNGSEGGLPNDRVPKALASGTGDVDGVAVLSLAYFGAEGLPDSLEGVPLEYFETALKWIDDHPEIHTPVGAFGWSRGGELALQIGSRFDAVGAVVAYAPSSHRFLGIPDGSRSGDPAWLEDGDPLPYVSYRFTLRYLVSAAWRWLRKRPLPLEPVYRTGMEKASEEELSAAAIRVENVDGPTLVVGGEDDRMWPSAEFCERLAERVGEESDFEHATYEGVGHVVGTPRSPTTGIGTTEGFVPRLPFALGGEPAPTAAAAREAWKKSVETLQRGLPD